MCDSIFYMGKGLLIGIIIFIVVLIAGGGYWWMQRSNTEVMSPAPAMTKNTPVMSDSPSSMAPEASNSTGEAMMTESVKSFTIEGSNFKFNPATITVRKGDKVKITFKSVGGMHDFVIDDYDIQTKMLDSGLSETVEFTADKAGSFEYYCSVGNHRQMGMKGTLKVE